MVTASIKVSKQNQTLIKNNPNIVNQLLSDYNELRQDKITKKELENSVEDLNLNIQLKAVLWIS